MKFFKRYYHEVAFDREQTRVKCPFHKDDNPSATINTDRSLFFCPVCGEGYNEVQFISKVNNIPIVDATKILDKLNDTDTESWGIVEKAELWGDNDFLNEVRKLISDITIEKLNLGLVHYKGKKFLGIPIFYNNVLVDVKYYNLLKHNGFPKMIGRKGGENGHFFPYDLINSDEKLYIFEGEKDAMVAFDMGINAVTLTGGASATPNKMAINKLKDKEVVIVYDNDDAGVEGRERLYKAIFDVAKSVKYIEINQVVNEDKEDFSDAVFKYGLDALTFSLLEESNFDEKLLSEAANYITIDNALRQSRIKKPLRSIVNVSAEYEDYYALPVIVEIEKVANVGNASTNTLAVGTKINWYYDRDTRAHQLLDLVEYNAKKHEIEAKILSFVGVPHNEKGVAVRIKQTETVYKYKVVDANTRITEDIDDNSLNNVVVDFYSFSKMRIGVEYDIKYALYPHPFKNQKLMGISLGVKELDLSEGFYIDKEKLDAFKGTGTVEERVERLFQSAKHHIAKHLNYDMWLMSDLVMNSILDIHYGVDTWGALDVFILGDTSTGKSEVTQGLVNLYDFGHFLSLKTATTIGLIGGSKKDGESMVNTIGAIPRQHKKLVVMEEFSGAHPNFIKTMTDIRTSRKIHIVRVSGELKTDCNLRMITISNPLGDDKGLPKYLSTYPNGVQPLMELINNPEDVSRYDGFILMPQITERFNPFLYKLEGEPIPKEVYEYKAKWTYTRVRDNVKYDEGVEAYIWEKAEELNDKYESNFPLFGTKAALKLARFSIALASLIVNTDESYENIIVTKEIVDFMFNYLNKIYDSQAFKLNEYKIEYDSYNVVTDKDIENLQDLYPRNSNLFDYLEGLSTVSLEGLRANSGLDMKDFNILYSKISQLKFVRTVGRTITPTTKFRLAMNKIDKEFKTSAGITGISSNRTFKID